VTKVSAADCESTPAVVRSRKGKESLRLTATKRRTPVVALLVFAALALVPPTSIATVFGSIRGIVHDPQHRPIAAAHVTLLSATSDYKQETQTDSDGAFAFTAVPLGSYSVTVEAPGFAPQQQVLVVIAGAAPVLHYQLAVAAAQEKVSVTASPEDLNPESPRRTISISPQQIARDPGVDSSTSFRVITEFVPSAFMVHDQLHVRGGHQVTWAIDGVPIPNTNIASNVGPQFNPKDVQYLEAQSGSYSAEYGDRTYGVFNVAMRTGFERDRQAELIASYGNFNSTDDQISFGDHNQKAAYYVSLSGNRTDYGLEPPTVFNLHNAASGGGGFISLIYNPDANDQLRFDGGARLDYYQVPNDPSAQQGGIDDRQREQDAYATFTWAHTFTPAVMLSLSPFYHFNRAAYEGGPNDVPIATDNRASNYEGGQLSIRALSARNNATVGVYAFAQQDNTFFSVIANDGSGDVFRQRVTPAGSLAAFFVEEQFKATSWLTLTGGLRLTHFDGLIRENAADPRLGVAVRVPRVGAILRAAYSRVYQAPPLDTLSGPLLQFAAMQGVSFLPLHGERDEQQEYGIVIPLRGWSADFDYFRTGARNFFDHDAIGNSNLFFPLTIAHARIKGVEATVRSPIIHRHYQAHLVYSNMQAEGFGGITGGLTDFSPPPAAGFYLDHDQRNTLSAGMEGDLPWRSFAAFNLNYGSGFLDGNGPAHLPGYQTFDLALGKSFGESFTLRVSATNIFNKRYQLDTSNTFGGTHFADPREVSVQLRYRFRY
jgi:outer membrane receptor protein involved in Fe transport